MIGYDRSKHTPLFVAAIKYGKFKGMLDKQLRIGKKDDNKIATYRSLAVGYGKSYIMLQRAGAHSSMKDAFGKTPTDYLGADGLAGLHRFLNSSHPRTP